MSIPGGEWADLPTALGNLNRPMAPLHRRVVSFLRWEGELFGRTQQDSTPLDPELGEPYTFAEESDSTCGWSTACPRYCSLTTGGLCGVEKRREGRRTKILGFSSRPKLRPCFSVKSILIIFTPIARRSPPHSKGSLLTWVLNLVILPCSARKDSTRRG